jgi:hypothetical protein
MSLSRSSVSAIALFTAAIPAALHAQDAAARCADLSKFQSRLMNVSITASRFVPAGSSASPFGRGGQPPQGAPAGRGPAPQGAPAAAGGPGAPGAQAGRGGAPGGGRGGASSTPLPAYCRVEGTIDPRTGVGGKAFGIGFALAMPENWAGRFLFQGGGGLNGMIREPLGTEVSGNASALSRGYAVVSNDTGHKGTNFDSSFTADQQAHLDFLYVANGKVAPLAKEIIAAFYGKPAEHSYFVGCSTGGREAMIMSQRYPSYFDGIVSGDPAIRTGHSNMALAFIGSTFTRAAQETTGKADYKALFSESDKKLVLNALLNACDANDGIKDGMIFGKCDFDPATLNCQGAKAESCLLPAQTAALKKALAGPRDSHGNATYAAFPYDVGIAEAGFGTPGLLSGPSIPVPVKIGADFDADAENYKLVTDYNARLGDSLYTNLSSYFGHNGKLIFYHGLSDAWFSPLDTLGYYERMAGDNGGVEKVSSSSRIFMVPGMGHCNGGAATLDQFDMLTAITDWVEKGTAPESVVATGRSFPGRSRPICAYPSYAQYTGQGDPNDAKNFVCKKP